MVRAGDLQLKSHGHAAAALLPAGILYSVPKINYAGGEARSRREKGAVAHMMGIEQIFCHPPAESV